MTDATHIAFDDDGQHVLAVVPPTDLGDRCPHCGRGYDQGQPCADDVQEIRERALRDLLQFLAADDDVRRIGWRCALAHWLIHPDSETQAGLAARLGVTGAAISQSLKAFRSEIIQWLQANHAP